AGLLRDDTQAVQGAIDNPCRTRSGWIRTRKPDMTKTLTTLMLVAGVLSGCTLAPHYDRPAAPVAGSYPGAPEGYAGAEVKSGETRRAADIGWREFFRDPRLQALIATSLENNRDLRTAALRIEEARAQYRIQRADLLPTVNANASFERGTFSS